MNGFVMMLVEGHFDLDDTLSLERGAVEATSYQASGEKEG